MDSFVWFDVIKCQFSELLKIFSKSSHSQPKSACRTVAAGSQSPLTPLNIDSDVEMCSVLYCTVLFSSMVG